MPRKEAHQFTPLLKDDFVNLLRQGKLRFEACNALEITPQQVQYAYRADPNFRSEVDAALLEATEPVESAVYKAALAGEPWASKWWLEHRDKERWGPLEQKITVLHSDLDGVALREQVEKLANELEMRKQHQKAIETGGRIYEFPPTATPYIREPDTAPVFHAHNTNQSDTALRRKAARDKVEE